MSQDGSAHVSALRAVAHPVRLRMLSLLTGAQLSAAEIARELHLTHANASYHLRVLARAGEVVEAGEERIRGGVAKRYRHPWDRVDPPTGESSPDVQQAYVRAMADELVRRSSRRSPAGAGSFTDAELWVDPQVWAEVTALVEKASRLVHAEAQPPRSQGTVHVNMSAALFAMDDDGPQG